MPLQTATLLGVVLNLIPTIFKETRQWKAPNGIAFLLAQPEGTRGGSGACNWHVDLVNEQIGCDPAGPLARRGSQLICEVLAVSILWVKPQSTVVSLVINADTVIHYGH